jgi:hypothetical protein
MGRPRRHLRCLPSLIVDKRHRRQKAERRRAHQQAARRPRAVLRRASYSVVKQGHIVPATYQRNFAIGGQVMVHLVDGDKALLMRVENAGTRSRAYRRTRPDGTQIDDVEASLAHVEAIAGPALRRVTEDATLDDEGKAILSQLVALQMLRGPVFSETTRAIAADAITEHLTAERTPATALAHVGGDLDVLHQRAADQLFERRFARMLAGAQKLSTIVGYMRWHILRFEKPVLAYSDQPVVLWPLGTLVIDARPTQPRLGAIGALEIRLPISPHHLLLLSWEDARDQLHGVPAPRVLAAETNALVIAQADKQWMHQPQCEPPIAKHLLRPAASSIEPSYDAAAANQSWRRAQAQRFYARVEGRAFVNDIQIVTEPGTIKRFVPPRR